jgi:hypothetical protein
MSEYIERSALLQSLKSSGVASDFALYKISNFPAADVAPVVHGEWVTIDGISRCSECEYIPAYDSAIDDLFYSPFCPNCGAKMDKEANQ